MKVIELARKAGANPDVVRHHARIGLLTPAKDAANGYRRFRDSDLARLRLVLRAKHLGFRLGKVAQVIAMTDHGRTPCPVLRQIVKRRIVETRQRLAQIQALQSRLEQAPTLWADMPDGEPDGHAVCVLLAATCEANAGSA